MLKQLLFSSEFEEFLQKHRVKHIKTALYHQQSSSVERFNRALKEGQSRNE